MTMNKLFSKLRSQNKSQYVLLIFCVFLSVLLVCAYAFMFFSSTVQDFLPEGGDTRKFGNLLLAVSMLGCIMFTVYASSLFFRYKSREYGIFLAMGTPRSLLNGLIFRELSFALLVGSLLGLVCAIPFSVGLWKLFQLFIISTEQMTYRLGTVGFLVGILFSILLAIILFICGMNFVRRSNVMDILRTSQKTEVGKAIPSWTGKLGIILILIGIFIGSGVPAISAQLFHQNITSLCSLAYLIAVYGVYLVLLHAVAQSSAIRHKKKYYNNLISISLMRFTAKTATRNMCVVTLLLFANLFSAFYGMTYYHSSDTVTHSENKRQFTFHFPISESTITRTDVTDIAQKHQMTIQKLAETQAANLVISDKSRDLNDSGKYFEINSHRESSTLFFSASSYQELTSQAVDVKDGSYKTITPTDYNENIFRFKDGLNEIYNPDSDLAKELTYDGTVEFDSLSSLGYTFAYVISDNDYEKMTDALRPSYLESFLSFDVKEAEASYPFAKELETFFIKHAGKDMAHHGYYDAWEAQLATKNGEDYGYGHIIDQSLQNTMLTTDWKYTPIIPIVQSQDALKFIAIFVLLSLYIFLITLAAISIMCYTRGISIAADNKVVFANLKKLGTNHSFNQAILKKQLYKIFQYPALVGSFLAFVFALSMTFFNDSRIQTQELKMLGLLALLTLLIWCILALVYIGTRKNAEQLADI